MRLLNRIVLVSLIALWSIGSVNQRVAWIDVRGDLVQWYKDKSGTLYCVGTDSVTLAGASDSSLSCIYVNKGKTIVQPFLSGGSSINVILKVQTALSGDSTITSLTDNHFKDFCWLPLATGISNSVIKTTETIITTTGRGSPIRLYLEDGQVFRFIATSTASHSGSTLIRLDIFQEEQ